MNSTNFAGLPFNLTNPDLTASSNGSCFVRTFRQRGSFNGSSDIGFGVAVIRPAIQKQSSQGTARASR